MYADDDRMAGPVVAVAERLDERRPEKDPPADPRLVVLHAPAQAPAEAFRAMYYSLRRSLSGAPLGVVGVTSAARGDGRSVVAANLALVAARETSRTVALVDADLRAPALHRLFGFDGEMGLSDVVSNRCDLRSAFVAHAGGNIDLLAGGRPEPEPARRFASPRFQRALASLRQHYDEVVVDLPPASFSDTLIVAVQCSCVVLVVRAGRTGQLLAQESVQALDGARIAGLVLNGASDVDAPALAASRRALPGRR